MTNSTKQPIRLTNRTARALREQARQQRTALYAVAAVLSVLLCGAAVIIGIEHLVAVPLCVLAAIALDAVIILLARGRYLSLTGQAICTEAAARQINGEYAEAQRITTARRDLQKIKDDLIREPRGGDDEEEEDEDMIPVKKLHTHPAPRQEAGEKKVPFQKPFTPPAKMEEAEGDDGLQGTRKMEPVSRRRRQGKLQVISADDPQKNAN